MSVELERIEAFLNRRIKELEVLASAADPRVSRDYDEQVDCFKEVLEFVEGLNPINVMSKNLSEGIDNMNGVFNMITQITKGHAQLNSPEFMKKNGNKECLHCLCWVGPTFQKEDGLCPDCRKVKKGVTSGN